MKNICSSLTVDTGPEAEVQSCLQLSSVCKVEISLLINYNHCINLLQWTPWVSALEYGGVKQQQPYLYLF